MLDTGVDTSHPDLNGKMTSWAQFDDQGLLVTGSVSNAHDSGSHGTHVAGTILGGAASGRAIGMAPEARLMGSRVLDPNGGSVLQIMAGMEWAINGNAHVINMSLGGLELNANAASPYFTQILTAFDAGIPVVCAVGNDGDQLTGAPGNEYMATAAGAHDYDDKIAAFSGGRSHVLYYNDGSYGSYRKPDFTAPGVDVYSSVPGNGYASMNGTSMASPHVAGAIALLLSATSLRADIPKANLVSYIKELIEGSVRPLGESGKDSRYGYGALDVYTAIDMAKERGY